MAIQACIPTTLCTIHNFIRTYDATEGKLPGDVAPLFDDSHDENHPHSATDMVEQPESSENQDQIASLMWEGYQHWRRDIAAEQGGDESKGSDNNEDEEESGLGSEFDDLNNVRDEFEDDNDDKDSED
jgi:hypothetical protein